MNVPKVIQQVSLLTRRILLKNSTHYPFISGDSFVELADCAVLSWHGNGLPSKKKIANAKVLFVKGDIVKEFMSRYSFLVNANVLITGNSDENFSTTIDLPASINLWLCQNYAGPDRSQIKTLPIGLENRRHGRMNIRMYEDAPPREKITDRVFLPPMSLTNPIRSQTIAFAAQNPDIFSSFNKLIPVDKYLEMTKPFKFIFCCEGNGFDTHRVWETLYQGNFPVLLDSKWSSSLKQLDLPILIVRQLNDLSKEMLSNFYMLNSGFRPQDYEVLWIPYWRELINEAIRA